MSTWLQSAEALLTTAGAAPVPDPQNPAGTVPLRTVVDRVFLAPGPQFAWDCSLLAVHIAEVGGVELMSAEVGCVIVPEILLHLTYADDCVPPMDNRGRAPAAEAVAEWSAAFYDRAAALWQHVADAVRGGPVDPVGGGDALIEPAIFTGPMGQMAAMTIPVRVRLQA